MTSASNRRQAITTRAQAAMRTTHRVTVLCLLAVLFTTGDADQPLFDLFGAPGGEEQKCTGAQIVKTRTALLVWGQCGGGAGVANRSVWLRRSTNWGGVSLPAGCDRLLL